MDPLYLRLLENLTTRVDEHYDISSDAFKEIKTELKEIRKVQELDIAHLKLSQAKCDSHWSLVGKALGLGGIGTLIATILSRLFGVHQ